MKRNTLVFVVIAIAAFFMIFNPVKACQDRNPTVLLPAQDEARLSPLVAFATSAWRSPVEAVVRSFDAHDVVFLGEFYKIREHVNLVKDLVPALRAAGVRNLGIEYALAESQADIDALLAAPAWSEAEARRITFTWVVTWGFQEYLDIYRAAWEENRKLAPGERPFRIVALGVRQNWEYLQTQADLEKTDVLQKILANGVPDAHMAEVIQREFLDRGEKALVYCSLQHAFTRYRSLDYEKNMRDRGFAETRRAGNILFDRVRGRVATLALHAPWPDSAAQTGLAWPVDGAIDAMLAALPPGRQAGGWSTIGTALGALPITTGGYASGHPYLTLSGLCDGYIATGPLTSLHAATAIADFVPADAAEYAVKNFPGPKPARLDAKTVNTAIVEEAQALEQALRRFK
ncbi:MAG TPA: ChaN family lipoprotein [Desulfobacterales bacterium]|nr:ChaN family lipoprotein [Desulfobacterales bacterium]